MSIECKYLSVSHVYANVQDGSPIHFIHFKPTKRDMHKSIKGFRVQPIAQMASDCILFEKPLSQIAIHDGMSIMICQSCISVGQFVCRSKLLPHMRQTSNIVLFSCLCWSDSVKSRSSKIFPYTYHFFFSAIYWNLNNVLSSHNPKHYELRWLYSPIFNQIKHS